MTLIATAKGSTSDSWGTLAEADAYHANRLFNPEWGSASDATKETALKWACTLLNLLSWLGVRTEATQSQAQPRYGLKDRDGFYISSDTIHQEMKNASFEYAWILIKGDTTKESETTGISKIKVAVVEIQIDKSDQKKKVPNNVLDFIRPWLKNVNTSSVGKG